MSPARIYHVAHSNTQTQTHRHIDTQTRRHTCHLKCTFATFTQLWLTNESWHTYEWVMSNTWVSHVAHKTHMNRHTDTQTHRHTWSSCQLKCTFAAFTQLWLTDSVSVTFSTWCQHPDGTNTISPACYRYSHDEYSHLCIINIHTNLHWTFRMCWHMDLLMKLCRFSYAFS